jgi:hypothetical protein
MVLERWLSPRTLMLGSVSLVASCAALGLTASRSASSSAAASPVVSAPTRAAPLAASDVQPASSLAKAPCGDDMVLVESTCVDRYEAHLLEQQADGTLTPYPAHQRPQQGHYVAASSRGSKPQAFISQR